MSVDTVWMLPPSRSWHKSDLQGFPFTFCVATTSPVSTLLLRLGAAMADAMAMLWARSFQLHAENRSGKVSGVAQVDPPNLGSIVEILFLLNGSRITVDLSIITLHPSWRLFRYDPRTERLWLARLAILSSWQEQYEAPCDLLACVWEYLLLSPTIRFLSEEVRAHRQDQPIRDIAGDGEALYVLSKASDTVRVVAPWGLFDTPSLGGIILAIAASESMVGRLFMLREDRSILEVHVFESASFTVLGEAIGVSPVQCERRHFAVVHRMPALAWLSTSSSIGILQLGCVDEAYLSICLTLPERSQFCGIFAVRAGRSSNEVFVFSVEGGSVLRQYSADLRNTTCLAAMRSWRLPVSSYVKGIFSVQVTNVAGRAMLVLGALGRVVVLDSEKEFFGIWENYRCYSAYHLVKYIVVEGKFIYFSCLNAKPYHKVYKQKIITNAIERGRESNARALRWRGEACCIPVRYYRRWGEGDDGRLQGRVRVVSDKGEAF
ncbi:hypothetical protein FOZ63_026026, partial [Perkinsus olseni]